MPNERSFFGLIENYIDMFVNAVAIYIAFFLTCLIDQNPPVTPTAPVFVMATLAVSIFTSFVYQAYNIYKPVIAFKFTNNFAIIRANILVFSILAVALMLFAGEANRMFFLFWALFTFVVSSAFLTFKRRIIIWVVNLLRKKQLIISPLFLPCSFIQIRQSFIVALH